MSMMWSESFDMPLRGKTGKNKSISDITHGVLYSKEEHENLYKPLRGRNVYIKNILEQIEEENEKKYRKQLEEREKMDILLSMSKEELEALKFMANENVKQKKHHERNKFGGRTFDELQEEIKNLEDDLTLHEETSFELQEENIKLRCEKNTLEHMVKILADEILNLSKNGKKYCQYNSVYECENVSCQDCIISWAKNKVKKELEEKLDDKN